MSQADWKRATRPGRRTRPCLPMASPFAGRACTNSKALTTAAGTRIRAQAPEGRPIATSAPFRVTPAVKLNINRQTRIAWCMRKAEPLGNGSERLNKAMYYATTAARLMTNSDDVKGTQPRVARRGSQPRLRGVEDGAISWPAGRAQDVWRAGGPLSLPMPPCCECTGSQLQATRRKATRCGR